MILEKRIELEIGIRKRNNQLSDWPCYNSSLGKNLSDSNTFVLSENSNYLVEGFHLELLPTSPRRHFLSETSIYAALVAPLSIHLSIVMTKRRYLVFGNMNYLLYN